MELYRLVLTIFIPDYFHPCYEIKLSFIPLLGRRWIN